MEIQTMMRGLQVDDIRNPPQFIYKNKNVKEYSNIDDNYMRAIIQRNGWKEVMQ